MWTYHSYRFAFDATWLSALAAEGWSDGTPPEVELLVGGTLYGPPPDDETPGEALPGWHVAAAFRAPILPPTAWGSAEIDPPEQMPVLGRTPVPQVVSRFQARAALAMVGLLTSVENAIASSNNIIAQLAWADAVQFERNSPTIAAMASALDLTEEQVDDLFRTASKIIA